MRKFGGGLRKGQVSKVKGQGLSEAVQNFIPLLGYYFNISKNTTKQATTKILSFVHRNNGSPSVSMPHKNVASFLTNLVKK